LIQQDPNGWTDVNISFRSLDTGTAIEVTGRLVAGSSGRELLRLRRTVIRLVDEGSVHLILDLSCVTDIDAEGLGTLVAIYRMVKQVGGCLTVAAPNSYVRCLLSVTRLDTVISVAPPGSGVSVVKSASAPFLSFLARAGPELD
jgi:anti-sigma B factor antagonist